MSNRYIVSWDCGHYIGRAGKSKKGSALANPFKLADASDSEERDCLGQCWKQSHNCQGSPLAMAKDSVVVAKTENRNIINFDEAQF